VVYDFRVIPKEHVDNDIAHSHDASVRDVVVGDIFQEQTELEGNCWDDDDICGMYRSDSEQRLQRDQLKNTQSCSCALIAASSRNVHHQT
jgi:hypothetical protein